MNSKDGANISQGDIGIKFNLFRSLHFFFSRSKTLRNGMFHRHYQQGYHLYFHGKEEDSHFRLIRIYRQNKKFV
jgi:hypothetical protein